MTVQPVGKIVYLGILKLHYRVKSKQSKKGGDHAVTFCLDGKRTCECIGNHWLEKRVDDVLADCRHKKLVTIYTSSYFTGKHIHTMILKALTDKTIGIEVAWGYMFCQQPKFYNPIALYCTNCKLFPNVCNIHKIKIPGKRNTLPLVWKLQGQIYAGKRIAAAKTIRKIMKAVNDLDRKS